MILYCWKYYQQGEKYLNAYLVLSFKGKALGSITSSGLTREETLVRAVAVFGPCRIREDK